MRNYSYSDPRQINQIQGETPLPYLIIHDLNRGKYRSKYTTSILPNSIINPRPSGGKDESLAISRARLPRDPRRLVFV
ncbi:MAG TPA: hypothetical protein VKK79_16530 [Candidatus Lokiarchaeia archaeon]|nr:hypothetical protein [Candidatus Lokiarchaeia archaeon]